MFCSKKQEAVIYETIKEDKWDEQVDYIRKGNNLVTCHAFLYAFELNATESF